MSKKGLFYFDGINKTSIFGEIYKFYITMNIPENLKFTKEHEWIRYEGDEAYVGITEFAASELGDIVYVEVETIAEALGGDEPFGNIEAVKTVSDLFMPVSGTVLEFNPILEDAPETINTDPYDKGWIIKISVSDNSEIEDLLSADAYKELIG